MSTDGTAGIRDDPNLRRLEASLHDAQAQGLLGQSDVVRQLLAGIVSALAGAVEGNARDPSTASVLQSDVYWDHFEMDIKESLLGAFAWVDPELYGAVLRVLNVTFAQLRKAYRYS